MTTRTMPQVPATPADRVRAAAPAQRPALPMLGLAVAALAATAAAVYTTAVSRHAPHPLGHAVLTVIVCLSFVGSGLLALRRPPYIRFGVLLAAVGFASLLGALHDANSPVPYTIGVLTANLVFAVLLHALLAFPHGRLHSPRNRVLVVAAYLDVLALQAVAVLFDPLTRWHSAHPRNLALIDSQSALSTGLEELEAAIAAALAIAAVLVLTRRARAATPAARQQLVPVLVGGKIALLFLSAGLVLAPLSSEAAVLGIGLGLLTALALPAAFLAILLQGRLSRSAVGELLVELREPGEPPGLRDALRRTLGDPTLDLARIRPEDGVYVDRAGEPLALPGPGETQVATAILHHGEPVGALVHDRSLRLRPELLDAVNAAAGFALANERALATVQQVEARSRALLDAIPDVMIRSARDGTYLDIRADNPAELVRPPEELIGRNAREFLPPAIAETVIACVERTLDTGRVNAVEYEIEIGGVARWKESRMVPSGVGEVVTIVRDFTEQRRAEAEQAALRRVAMLVAKDAPPEEVFQSVTEEVCRLLGIRSALLLRFEEAETASVVGKYGEPYEEFMLGSLLRLEDGAALTVLRTGAPARIEYRELPGQLAAQMLELGFHASVGVPIVVGGVVWGALIAAMRTGTTLPLETERRLQGFAELVALAVASAHTRNELAASRLRIIEASDAERRRLERNLHDGAQQRLVALAVGLRLAQTKIGTAPDEAAGLLGVLAEDLTAALTELRELARGIHPAVLTERGLPAALEVLAARTPLPVAVDVELSERLPEPVEAAAYYVVSEALANIVKHAGADAAAVRVARVDGAARVEVEDDGVGGAQLDGGSGLRGLRDRVETLAGRLEVTSPPGHGTLVLADIPVPCA
jgi:signal transduction histidine kinase/PAS domain-containing protein